MIPFLEEKVVAEPERADSVIRKPGGPNPGLRERFLLSSLAALCLFMGSLFFLPVSAFAKFIQLDGVVDVKSRFSTGCSSVEDLAGLAQSRGIDTLVFGDYARDSMEYGIVPFERIFRKKDEKASVLANGVSVFISEINDIDQRYPETMLIPAVEVAPYYFWTGNIFDKDLEAHNWDKHLLVVGLNTLEDYEQLPILNSNFSQRHLAKYQYYFLGFGVAFLVCLGAAYKGFYRKIVVPVGAVLFLLAINYHPFQSSGFSQYGGDAGIEPYQELIGYANSKEGMIFWSHPEKAVETAVAENVLSYTLPHSEDLVLSRGYTGFQSVSAEPVRAVEPANEWDHVLMEYVHGERNGPVWGYGGNDFVCEDNGGIKLGAVRTIFLVREKTREAVLDALRSGRMYSVYQEDFGDRLSLTDITVSDATTGQEATLGQEVVVTDFPQLNIKVNTTKGSGKTAHISVMRNGQEVKQETATLPYDLTWRDLEVDRSGMIYYRVLIHSDPSDRIVSNPIFVRFAKEGEEVASLPPAGSPREVGPPAVPAVKAPAAPGMSIPSSPEKPMMASTKQAAIPTVVPGSAPSIPQTVREPKRPRISEPSLGAPTAPEAPAPVPGQQYAVARIDGVSLKKGPGTVFLEVGKAAKGERLLFVRRTRIEFNGKVWLVVKKDGRTAYVWEGLVEIQ